MEQHFSNLQEAQDYRDFLQMKGREVPAWVQDELTRLEAAPAPDEYIFSTMKAHNPFMTEEKERVVREMTDQLLTDAPHAEQPCLLLGKVQCGKTDTFLSIMGLCFDRGIDIAVVMTKGTRTLTNQTIKRLEKDFRFFADDDTYGQKAIVSVHDILDVGKIGHLDDYIVNDPAHKIILVVKKEDTNMKYLRELFTNNKQLCQKRVLVCDDEADFASRNYYREKNAKRDMNLLAIAEHIHKFVKLPHYCRYLQITATPYSLYLQPDGSLYVRGGKEEVTSWLPRYTGLVPIHDRYVGGHQYYDLSEDETSMYSCLYEPVNDECLRILSGIRDDFYAESNLHSESLTSLSQCIVMYLFAAAVRSIQERRENNRRYRTSCLIHCEVTKEKHRWQETLVTKMFESLKEAVLGKGNADMYLLELERYAFDSLSHSHELAIAEKAIDVSFPTFAEIEAEVRQILGSDDYQINRVNSDEHVSGMLNENGQLRLDRTMNIFIGGSILDRGITIDHMLCFLYGRNPGKFQMDTVLQHARMYGARDPKDMAVTRFFTSDDIYDVLKTINDIDTTMYDYLRRHPFSVQTDDFTSMVIGYDRRIKAAAANKILPSNTKVIKRQQRILPIGFQTAEPGEMERVNAQVRALLDTCPGYANVTDEKPFFLMPYATAFNIIKLVSAPLQYSPELENMDKQWDENEMLTALDHCTWDGDGQIWCLVREGRNMSRELDQSKTERSRWSKAPESGNMDLAPAREKATDRPVLMLLGQTGKKANGWNDAPFYWPVLLTCKNINAGIFTINKNKKARPPREQHRLKALDSLNPKDVLIVRTDTGHLIVMLNDELHFYEDQLSRLSDKKLLQFDLLGLPCRAEGVDPNMYLNYMLRNESVFPFVVRDYKYILFKNSPDWSGSQVLVKVREETPHKVAEYPLGQDDVIYDDQNKGEEAHDDTKCIWRISYYFDQIIDKLLTDKDAEELAEYQAWRAEHPDEDLESDDDEGND